MSRAADNRGQQIIEVVRDAAGQLAHRFHLLRLPQCVLTLAVVGDVTADRIEAIAFGDGRPRDPECFTVFSNHAVVEPLNSSPASDRRDHLGGYRPIVRVNELHE